MSAKSASAGRYAAWQKSKHGAKQWAPPINAIITGDVRLDSIGERIRQTIVANGGVVRSYANDLRDPVELGNFNFSGSDQVNTLIMCHGVTYLEWFEEASISKLIEVIDVNLTGSLRMAQSFVGNTIDLPHRKKIISIGSMAYKAVLNGSAAYCASKAGLAQLMKCLAWELAPKGFDVFSIHPSNVEGAPMSEETILGLMRYRGLTREEAEAYWNDNPIRFKPDGSPRSLTTDEIAGVVMMCLSEAGTYLSGSNIELAGGQR
jgi:NAD(P)-dependent dehydrogenase (short-subunit alcohol dehydrogenase family)